MAERFPREQALRRVHGPGALFAAAYGNVGSSIYYALGVVALFALGLTPVTFMIAGLIFVFTAATYTEATVMYPEAGGSSSFARHAFNEVVSFFAAWGQMLTYIITVAISAFFVPHYLAVFWEPLGHGPGDVIAGVVLIAAARGAERQGHTGVGAAEPRSRDRRPGDPDPARRGRVALVLDPALLVCQVDLGTAPTWGDFALGIAVGMVAYTGIETISNMAEEAKKPFGRTIPRGVGLRVAGGGRPLRAAAGDRPLGDAGDPGRDGEYTTELGTTFADDPVLGIVENIGLGAGLTDVLRIYVGILAAVILLIATNAALIGVSRLTYSMGHYRQLPERLRQIHPRFRTPYIAILVFSVVAILTVLPGETAFLATMYSFGAMLSFTIAHVSVIRLRQRRPEIERGWRPPLNIPLRRCASPAHRGARRPRHLRRLGRRDGPRPDHARGRRGLDGVRDGALPPLPAATGLPLTRRSRCVTPEPLGVEEVEYAVGPRRLRRSTRRSRDEVVATAVKLAGGRRRGIHVHSMLTVPKHLPLDAKMKREEGEARSKIEQAKLIGGLRVTGHVERVRPGQAGYSIAEEAETDQGARRS